jgi:Icc protein
MQVLHLTDPHLYGRADGKLRGVETDSSLRAVLEAAFRGIADYAAILVTGDLVQDDPDGYLRFRSIFANLPQPVLCIPGNHDEPAAMQRELRGAPFQIGGSRSIGGWQFVMLDSYAAGEVGGRLAEPELARLDACLAATDAHAVVCLHHHPVAMGSLWLDGIGLADPEAFWRVIDSHPHVRAVVWGHVHQAYDGHRGRVRLFATPSTGAQFLPASDRYTVDLRPPAYRRLRLLPDGRIESTVCWLDAKPAVHAAAR